MPRIKTPSLKRLEQLHPVDKEKELRKLLLENKNKKFLRIINEEIEKTELEQEHLESLANQPKKVEEPKELGTLVKKEAEELEEEKKEKIKIGKIYGVKEEHKEHQYSTYAPYSPHEENIKIEITNTTQTNNTQELNTAEESIKKTTELYMSKRKKEGHGH